MLTKEERGIIKAIADILKHRSDISLDEINNIIKKHIKSQPQMLWKKFFEELDARNSQFASSLSAEDLINIFALFPKSYVDRNLSDDAIIRYIPENKRKEL